MAYDLGVAGRVRKALARQHGVTERKMFGGIAFLLHGNMCCGVLNHDLVLRLGDAGASAALKQPHVRAMDYTGKPMASMVYVGPQGYITPKQLSAWIAKAVTYAASLKQK